MKNDIFVTRAFLPEYEEFVEAIKPLWESCWLTNMGKYHQELEKKLKEYLEVSELSLTVNGHMALELILQAFGFPEGAEVITPPFTFISTTHAIVRNNLKPVFCDVKPEDGTIDETKIEDLITEHTVAILPVHVYGNICNVEEIERIAYKYGLRVIYDAAHSFGEKYKGRSIGSFGDASVFSFHATKVYNTIEGGAVAFSDHCLYEKLYNLKNFGIRGEELVTEVGANAKMNEMSAIMGLCNLRHISRVIDERKHVCEYYDRELLGIAGIRSLRNTRDTVSNYSYYPIIVEDGYCCDRNTLYERMAKQGIHPRKYFYPITSDQACFKNKYRACELTVSRELSKRVLALPIYAGMAQEDIERVMGVIRE